MSVDEAWTFTDDLRAPVNLGRSQISTEADGFAKAISPTKFELPLTIHIREVSSVVGRVLRQTPNYFYTPERFDHSMIMLS